MKEILYTHKKTIIIAVVLLIIISVLIIFIVPIFHKEKLEDLVNDELEITLSSKEQEELIKNSKKCKRRFYSPPLNYSIYYDLAYDTVISDAAIRYKISHDIETGLIQCE